MCARCKHRNRMPTSRNLHVPERQATLPSQTLPLRAWPLRLRPMKAVPNKHLKSSIQKITKSQPFIPLHPSHCNENMYLTEKTLGLHSPWPRSPFLLSSFEGSKCYDSSQPLPKAAASRRTQRLPNPEGSGEPSSPRYIPGILSPANCVCSLTSFDHG